MTVAAGDDGRLRCRWCLATPEYRAYHDEEWGRPVSDEIRIYEKLCLEGFQAGLSWLTILRKREAFRTAFAGFAPPTVAAFDETDVQRLLGDPGIIRHRGKIEAAITNARATMALREAGTSLAAVFWSHRPAEGPGPAADGDVPGATTESKALSGTLRRHGFRFVGPTTVYAAMQALGVVNDHMQACAFRVEVEAERRRFRPPR
ncbi:MAG TPA: DNA-3-methyladenine glycosylase I [Acidimicrobiales bacterium]|nr:DNA-3-methyladenine glycosylase I [Acidimicrobiales bacterium]